MKSKRVAWEVVWTMADRGRRCVLSGALLLAVGCGDDASVSHDAMPMPDTMVGADAASCAAGTFPMSVTFRMDSFTGPALADVEACVITHPDIPCASTGIDGTWSFCAPANSEIAISAQKAGYMSVILPRVTGTSQPTDNRARIFVLNAPNCTPWTSGGASCPPSTSDAGGLLWIGARENMPGVDAGLNSPPGYPAPLGDVVVTLDPPASVGPFYIVNGVYDASLTATHAAAGNALAGGVTEGDQQIVRLAKPNQSCHAFAYDAWPGPEAQTVRVPIRRGFRTFAAVTCE